MRPEATRPHARFFRWGGGAKVVIDLCDDAPVEPTIDLWEMAGMATAHSNHQRWERTPERYRIGDEAIGSRFDPFLGHLSTDHPSEAWRNATGLPAGST